MIKKSKSYVGTYTAEDLAARIYDFLAIKNRGNKTKTNFYIVIPKKKKFDADIDFKAKNLRKIMSELLNQN